MCVAGLRDSLARDDLPGRAIALHYRDPIKVCRDHARGEQTGYAAPDHERMRAIPGAAVGADFHLFSSCWVLIYDSLAATPNDLREPAKHDTVSWPCELVEAT